MPRLITPDLVLLQGVRNYILRYKACKDPSFDLLLKFLAEVISVQSEEEEQVLHLFQWSCLSHMCCQLSVTL